MSKFALFEKIGISIFCVSMVAALISVPVFSYNNYKEYLEEIEENEQNNVTVQPRPVLESIEATLKEGVVYYANDIAEAKNEHFNVIANYTLEGSENYQEIVETSKFEVSTAATFYKNGGDITVSYRGKTDVVKVELVPVALESLSVLLTPYTINYATGDTFNPEGMVIQALYNDGSSKTLESSDYIVDQTTQLKLDDTKVVVSYTEGEITKTVDVAIKVFNSLDNGSIKSVIFPNKPIVDNGDLLTNATIEVNGVYENGNRVLLSDSEYQIIGDTNPVFYGNKYQIEVKYTANDSIKTTSEVIVRQKLEGENATIIGGTSKTEAEYIVQDGQVVEAGYDASFAGGFTQTIIKGNEGSVTFSLESATETVSDLTLRCSNSYIVKEAAGYIMKPLQINTILDLTINGRVVNVPSTVVLKGCGPHEKYAPLFNVYYEFTIKDVTLDPGHNAIKFNFKESSVGQKNTWNEPIATLNIDYINIDTTGNVIPETYEIKSIAIGNGFMPAYADKISDIKIPVIATIENGTKILLDESLYNVLIQEPEGADGEFFQKGEYKISVELKADSSIRDSITIIIDAEDEFVVLKVKLEQIDNSIYYTFAGKSIGFEKDDIILFDGDLILDGEMVFTLTTFELKIDVTNLDLSASANKFFPHMKINGENYFNDANSNGDIRGMGLNFVEESITFNGKIYSIITEWSMPVLNITNV